MAAEGDGRLLPMTIPEDPCNMEFALEADRAVATEP